MDVDKLNDLQWERVHLLDLLNQPMAARHHRHMRSRLMQVLAETTRLLRNELEALDAMQFNLSSSKSGSGTQFQRRRNRQLSDAWKGRTAPE
jgi:hypothetical protein